MRIRRPVIQGLALGLTYIVITYGIQIVGPTNDLQNMNYSIAATRPAQPQRQRVNIIFPGATHFFPKDLPPPLEPLLRFYMLEHTYSYPQEFAGLVCLYKFRLVGSKYRKVFPCARVRLADLASPGSSVTWHIGDIPYSTWYCSRGRFFVAFGWRGKSSTGRRQHQLIYSPYHGRHVPGEVGWGTLPPDRPEAHKQRNCKQVKGT